MKRLNLIGAGYLACAIALAAVQMWWLSTTIPPADAITYYDVADQIAAVGYGQALPLHWAPLYPLYVLLARVSISGSLEHELFVTAAADALLLVLLVGTVMAAFHDIARRSWPGQLAAARAWFSYGAGLTLFLSFAIFRVGLRMPDPLVTLFAVVAVWLWCRAFFENLSPRLAALAGVMCGAAFLARANLLHWAALVAVVASVAAPGVRVTRRAAALLAFVVGFVVIAGPHTYALSRARGTFAWGEDGRFTMAIAYGATWPASPDGVSAWPPRLAGGDVRLLTDPHVVSFPGFYEPGREFEDAAVTFVPASAARTAVRAAASCLVGNATPSFAMLWPLLWAAWPIALFGLGRWRNTDDQGDPYAVVRRRIAALMMVAGAAGVAMHLATFCNGYYLPPYMILGCAGAALATVSGTGRETLGHRYRAAHLAGVGFVAAAAILTARYARPAEVAMREQTLRATQALAAALRPLPTAPDGLRKIAVAGSWIGLYAVRLSGSQVAADLPDAAVLVDPSRRDRALAALRENGIAALLVPTAATTALADLGATPVEGSTWSLIDLSRALPADADSGS